ncbi:hypothetical protein LOAG_07864 [Loa loa]|uniref:Uncharacterized protein n=1 Tax=Loa loa TaxID=7209 RepID=A0A1S0TUV8_LOALO|nr:hypothetical protein LOAG_07864 [Loa loa]EFO20624.1 hypothetical protein LOAG_07864 [Loa loa]
MNSVASMNLLTRYDIINGKTYNEQAQKIFESVTERLRKYPFVLTKMVSILQKHVIVVGSRNSWLQNVNDHLKLLVTATDFSTAYICEKFECSLPVTSVKELKDNRKTFALKSEVNVFDDIFRKFNFQHTDDGAAQQEHSMLQLYCSNSSIGRKLIKGALRLMSSYLYRLSPHFIKKQLLDDKVALIFKYPQILCLRYPNISHLYATVVHEGLLKLIDDL